MDYGTVDLAIIGGGVNGAGIARDAAGRGLKVLLCEKGDLAEGTSSRSGKLVHGGLRYLEYYEFRLVREALIEREVLLRAAPHIIWPMRFVLPHSPEQRPAWMVRLGPVPLRPSRRPQAAAALAHARPAHARRKARAIKPEYHDRLRIFGLLGRRCAARRAERARRPERAAPMVLTRTAATSARRDGRAVAASTCAARTARPARVRGPGARQCGRPLGRGRHRPRRRPQQPATRCGW